MSKAVRDAKQSKFEHLSLALGNLGEYANTGWIWNEDDGWYKKWKNEMIELPSLNQLPEAGYTCPCTTKIYHHCLIQHKSGSYHFVGNECIKRFGESRRRCVDCNEFNRCKSLRCSKCRKQCKLHKTYHSDNKQHTKIVQPQINNRNDSDEYEYDSDDSSSRVSTQIIRRIPPKDINPFKLTFGKYRSQDIREIDDDEYIQWLVKRCVLDQHNLGLYVIAELLPHTRCLFGKYKGWRLGMIKDKGWLRWAVENTDHLYLRYLI